jgi:hypothetical protein
MASRRSSRGINRNNRAVSLPIAEIVKCLAAGGWTWRDFRANHMEHVAHLYSGMRMVPLQVPFERYWRTVAKISTILQGEGLFHVILKTRRSYPYSDTNVDVYVKHEDAPSVKEALCGESWRMPSASVLFKQRLIEREKVKLPARQADLVPAHLYMSVSWRYQREVTFLDDAMIERIPISAEAPGLEAEFGSLTVPVPTRNADILLHCAEIVFENYRITLGEALYIAWLIDHVSDSERDEIYGLGRERGALTAMQAVLSRVRAMDKAGGVETDWPRNLTLRELVASWGERFRTQLRRRRLAAAFEEWLAYAAFASMYRVKRALFR